jgi:V-type H+-transporting ATPase subunit a
MKSG